MRKLAPFLVMLGLAPGCRARYMPPPPIYEAESSQTHSVSTPNNVLGVSDSSLVTLGRYTTTVYNEPQLRLLAGLYAGTVSVEVLEKRVEVGGVEVTTRFDFSFEGSYSEMEDPQALKRVLTDADTNEDMIVTNGELMTLKKGILDTIISDHFSH